MKQLYKLGFCLAALIIVASCTSDNPTANFDMEKPEALAVQDSINSNYTPLKTYIDSLNSNFTLGAGVSASTYSDQGTMYRLVSSNFQEVTAKDLAHGTIVQGNGNLGLETANSFFTAAGEAGVSVYGKGLLSHNENEERLNRIIGPDTLETAGPSWVVLSEADFETDDASNYSSNDGAATSFTAQGEGAYGEGRALQIVNAEVRDPAWESQFFMTFDPHVEAGDQVRFSMDVRAEQEATFPTQAHDEPGGYIHWDFFGQISATSEWSQHFMELTVGDQAGAGTIAFNLGATATTYYFDNMKVEYYDEEGGVVTEEKTPEEKEQILTAELETWVSTMVDTTSYVDTWEVVSEPIAETSPMSGQNGFSLKSSGQFDWHEYLGADYGVQAFAHAREHGGQDALLFISDYGLEENLAKTDALINYVEYIENNGSTVDGIATQMDISINTDKQNITQMFEKLAATGKMIKVSGLEVSLGEISVENASSENWEQQSEMYKYVVDEYFNVVPEEQRYGISASTPVSTAVGLWNMDYERKRAYAGFAVGLQNAFNSGN